MRITGYALREAIKQHELRRDTAFGSFAGSLKKFPDEVKEAPSELVKQFLQAERAISQLQTSQMRYNLAVMVEVYGEKTTLAQAIKSIGGIARAEKMWRSAVGPKEDKYGYSDDVRDPKQLRATPTVTTSEAAKNASRIAKTTGAIRQAIAIANATVVEIEDLDAALLE